jgi:hypothetical protein
MTRATRLPGWVVWAVALNAMALKVKSEKKRRRNAMNRDIFVSLVAYLAFEES